MHPLDGVALAVISIGAIFFLAGTVGILRFPDAASRLHALTKADNLGLGFIVLGLVLVAGSPAVVAKLIIIWALALTATATTSQLIAGVAVQSSGNARKDEDRG